VSAQKTEIQNKLSASFTQAENMFVEYEQYAENRENLYLNKLRSVVKAKKINPSEYTKCGFEKNSISDDKQIENKMFIIHSDLFPTNYNEMKDICTAWLIDAHNIVETWKPIGIVDIVNDVERRSNGWLETLTELSTARENCEDVQTKDFEYNLSFEDVKIHFATLGDPTLLTGGLSALAYLLMLFSWIITKRDFRFPGFKIIFGIKKNKIDNEL
jgi:hypothetical protein